MKTQALDNLFLSWEESYEENAFVRDGIFCEEKYNAEPKKILFLLRDPHIIDRTIAHDLRIELIQHPEGEGRTWNNVARWVCALLDSCAFSQVDHISPEDLSAQLSRVAAINLKKEAGKANADPTEINNAARLDYENLRKEIKICAPDIIVACGTYDDFFKYIPTKTLGETTIDLRLGKKKIRTAYIDDFSVPVIQYRHPGQGCNSEKSFADMLEVAKYIFTP